MKVDVLGIDGKGAGKTELPDIFDLPLRQDIVARVYRLVRSHGFQPKGRDPMAGEKTTAETHNPPTGTGQSRIPRVKGERYSRSGMAGGVASVVKGRLPHPPKSEKVIHLRVNKKERKLATETAIAYTGDLSSVRARGHRVGKVSLPIVVSDELESLDKTSAVVEFMRRIGLSEELERLYDGIRRKSGKARLRGRAYRERVGPLIVVTNDRGIGRAAAAIPGVEVKRVDSLGILELAPGGVPGRLTIWTESALQSIAPGRKEVVAVAA
jgi:large subunit ribosomal protein L4e